MQVNIDHIVICAFICVAMISQGIVFSVSTVEKPDPDGSYGTRGDVGPLHLTLPPYEFELVPLTHDELVALTHEELVEKVRAQEKRIIRLELIIGMFKSSDFEIETELNNPMFETEIDATVDKIVDTESGKQKIVIRYILVSLLILLVVVGIITIFKLVGR